MGFWTEILTAEALSRLIDFAKDKGPKLKDRLAYKKKIISQLEVEKGKHVSDIPELSFEFSFEAYAETIVSCFSDKGTIIKLVALNQEHREIETQRIINKCICLSHPQNHEAERLIEESVRDFCQILFEHYYEQIPVEERVRDAKMLDEICDLFDEKFKPLTSSSKAANNSKTARSVVTGTSYKPAKNANKFNSCFSWNFDADDYQSELKMLNHLAKTLTDIPLTTRKVFARMVLVMSDNNSDCVCNMDEVTTYFTIENWIGTLAPLVRVGFISEFDQSDYDYYGYERRFFKDFDQWPIWTYIKIFCEESEVDISRIFEDIDFTVFDE